MATSAPETLPLPGARLLWWPGFLAPRSAQAVFEHLQAHLQWDQRSLVMFGRRVPEPRLTAWYGDPDHRRKLATPTTPLRS